MQTLKKISFRFCLFYVCLFIISLPFPYHTLPEIGVLTSRIFQPAVQFTADFFHPKQSHFKAIAYSDSLALYIQSYLIIPIALIFSLLSIHLIAVDRCEKIKYLFHTFISYYLALHLFKYGFDKIFKHQFYLPEPNILYTPLGHLSKDILYWSTIGSSYSYSVFAGLVEIIPATLLLFKKTRLLGGALSFLVLTNVLMINIGFDISVKIYAGFLLGLSLLTIQPYFQNLFHFFWSNNFTKITPSQDSLYTSKNNIYYALGKAFVIVIILFESLFAYFKTNNFNDDLAKRPFLHGAYQTVFFKRNNVAFEDAWKRVFIHRNGYFICQSVNDEMMDFPLKYDIKNDRLLLKNELNKEVYSMNYFYTDSTLTLAGMIGEDTIYLEAVQQNLEHLPIRKDLFHWSVESYLKE